MTTEASTRTHQFEARQWREALTRTNPVYNDATRREEDKTTHFPAEWAVYHAATGVRMAYASAGKTKTSEEIAQDRAARWNAGDIPDAMGAKAEAATWLHKHLKPGDTIKTILKYVSRSGMLRRISCVICVDGEVTDITWQVARLLGEPLKNRAGWVQDVGIEQGGCGMDMGFNLVYNLGREMYPDGFGATEGTAPNGKTMNTNVGGGIRAGLRPITHKRIAELVARGWKFRGRNGDGSGWDNDGGYALQQRWL